MGRRVELAEDVTAADVELYRRVRAAVTAKRARIERERYETARAALLEECPHPALLAKRFDPGYVITPAVEMVSTSLRDAFTTYSGRRVVSVPPQELKTSLLRWLCFHLLLDNPDRRIVFASYADSLARMSGRIVRSYVESLGGEFGLATDQAHRDAADWQLDGRLGGMVCVGVGGGLTGKPADCLIIDDPTRNQQDADSPTIRENLMEWWQAVGRLRLAPGSPVIVVQTRWAEQDLAGTLIALGWPYLNIPALADGHTEDALCREAGTYLESTRGRTAEDWEAIRSDVGERVWASLMQGRPAPLEGGIFKQAWFDDHRVPVAPELTEVIVAVDPAETGLGDEAGILVAGVGLADRATYLMADLSGKLSQYAWARKVCLAWVTWEASRVVQERTLGQQGSIGQAWSLLRRQAVALVAYGSPERASEVLAEGGDTAAAELESLREVVPVAEAVVDAGDGGPRVVTLTPKQSKRVRAESATQPFETGRAHIVGRLAQLEHEAVTWQEGQPSPNRLDCLSLVITNLDRTSSRSRVLV